MVHLPLGPSTTIYFAQVVPSGKNYRPRRNRGETHGMSEF